jgi:ADP-ribose pyrophosphatase YjhB (NUDIX family)
MIKYVLLKIWRVFPAWLQEALSRIVRPLFQVFAVAVIFNKDEQVMLVKSTYQKVHPWGLPGGNLNYGESPEVTVVREVLEETGLCIEVEKFLLVKTWLPDRVGLYYLCSIKDGEFHSSDEVSELGYFAIENLPDVRPLDIEIIEQLYGMVEYELA